MTANLPPSTVLVFPGGQFGMVVRAQKLNGIDGYAVLAWRNDEAGVGKLSAHDVAFTFHIAAWAAKPAEVGVNVCPRSRPPVGAALMRYARERGPGAVCWCPLPHLPADYLAGLQARATREAA